ncbi:MAG: DUF2799 domain-containing protein [Pseudomonadota bacterium]
MVRALKRAGIAVALLTLAACAGGPSYDAESCAAIDWYALGQQDGANGQAMTALNDEITQCRAFGIEADVDTYSAGRDEGLKTYCQPAIVLEASLKAIGDPFSCKPMSDEVRAAMEKGRETRSAVARYQNVKGQYDQLIERRDQINQEGSQLTQRYNASANETERQQIAQRINYLQQQLSAVEAEIAQAGPVMEEEQAAYEAAAASYEAFRDGLPPVAGAEPEG